RAGGTAVGGETGRQAARHRHEPALAAAELDRGRVAAEAEVARVRAAEATTAKRLEVEHAIALDDLRRGAANRQTEAELRFAEARQRIANDTSAENLKGRLIEALPQLAANMPKPDELRAVSIGNGGDNQVASLIAQVMS